MEPNFIPNQLLKAIADPTRRGIFERLCREGETRVGCLAIGAGVSQPAVSKHLSTLKKSGLVVERQVGRQTFYDARPMALRPITDWTNEMSGFWTSRLDRLEELLKRMDQ